MLKKIILAATGAAILAAAPASAQNFGGHNGSARFEQSQAGRSFGGQQNRFAQSNRGFAGQNRFVQERGVQARRWNQGERFDSRFATNYRVIGNPDAYRLRAAPYGYRWVQSGDDAVLVAIASGLIGAITGNALH
jgi:Ni/Co efflux regulator RcnB